MTSTTDTAIIAALYSSTEDARISRRRAAARRRHPASTEGRISAYAARSGATYRYGTSRPGWSDYTLCASREDARQACEWHTSTQFQAYAQMVEERTITWPSGRVTTTARVIAEWDIGSQRWLSPAMAAGYLPRSIP